MKQMLLAAAAVVAVCGSANAATVVYNALPATGPYFAPSATTSTGTGYEQDVTGSIAGLRTSPFSDSTTAYDAVEVGGSATFSAGTFGTTGDSFSFVWGTPDTYNLLTFLSGGVAVDTLSGIGNGSGSFLATVTSSKAFDSVKFESVGSNAFEFAAVSSVPLPASLPLFGTAILGLGAFAFVKKRGAKAASAV